VTTVALFKKLGSRFVNRPLPSAVFELAPGRLSGIRVSTRSRSVRGRFIQPFRSAVLNPSFDRPNVTDADTIKAAIERGKKFLGVGGASIALLIPEPCVRIFVLTADSLPSSTAERDSFVRWRVGKMMPVMPEDLRMDYDVSSSPGPSKIIVSSAREAVVREYEGLIQSSGMHVGMLTVPSLSLVNLLRGGPERSFILLNIEADYLSLLTVMNSEWTLYRQKGIGTDVMTDRKAELVVKEVENTVHFLEDREGKKVEGIRVRSESWEDGAVVVSRLQEVLGLPAEVIEYEAPEAWDVREKAILAPLVGQIS
jgi:hypothetical protein